MDWKVLLELTAPSEFEILDRYDIWPISVERSRDAKAHPTDICIYE
jgi:hypothetical protein